LILPNTFLYLRYNLLFMGKVIDTSKAAYESLRAEEIRTLYAGIIAALKVIGKGNFEDISSQMGVKPERVWKRLSELKDLELIYRTGEKKMLSSRRFGYVWALTGDTFPKSQPVEKSMKGQTIATFSRNIEKIKNATQASLFNN